MAALQCGHTEAVQTVSWPSDDDPAGEREVTTYTFLIDYRVAAQTVGATKG